MTQPPIATIAKRAFYDAMKSGGESEAMWIAAANAVVEECAKAIEADLTNHQEKFTSSEVCSAGQLWEAYYTAGHRAIAAIRALKGNANG